MAEPLRDILRVCVWREGGQTRGGGMGVGVGVEVAERVGVGVRGGVWVEGAWREAVGVMGAEGEGMHARPDLALTRPFPPCMPAAFGTPDTSYGRWREEWGRGGADPDARQRWLFASQQVRGIVGGRLCVHGGAEVALGAVFAGHVALPVHALTC